MLNEATMAADAKRKELMEKVREEVDQVKSALAGYAGSRTRCLFL